MRPVFTGAQMSAGAVSSETSSRGSTTSPSASVQLSLLAVSDPIVDLARALLSCDDVRIYSAEAWAKFTGAANYDQLLHRDYLNHTLVVPTDDLQFQQVEVFVYLVDVPDDLGPPHLVSQTLTQGLPAKPNWYPCTNVDDPDGFVSPTGRSDLYESEISGAGPAGTVIAFQPGTLHRGTGLTAHHGARYSMQLCFRPAGVEWGQRRSVGRPQPLQRVVRVRRTRHPRPTRTFRLPTARPRLLDSPDAARCRPPIPRLGHLRVETVKTRTPRGAP